MPTTTHSGFTRYARGHAALSLCLLGLAASGVAAAGTAAVTRSGFDLTLERAVELQDAGSFDAALQIYRSLREDRPGDARLLYEMARASLSAGDFDACVNYARAGVASPSRHQADAFGVMAKCQQRAGDDVAALNTLAEALKASPDDAPLHFEYALALRERDRAASATEFESALHLAVSHPDLYLSYAAVFEREAQEGGALLMRLRYIMSAPQSPAATGSAEQVLKSLDADAGTPSPGDALAAALVEARQAAGIPGTNPAERLNRFLQTFVLGVVSTEDPSFEASPLWSGGVEPLLAMADQDVLGTFLYFVGALARTEGSPEWLAAHRPEFERLVEYLARQGTT